MVCKELLTELTMGGSISKSQVCQTPVLGLVDWDKFPNKPVFV